MIFLVGQLDPHCSCCKWQHKFLTFDDNEKEKALCEAKELEKKGWDITIIEGKELDCEGGEI